MQCSGASDSSTRSRMPPMPPCPNGPCAALFGPCTDDNDCVDGNVCIDDMNTCKNMIVPCCQIGSETPPNGNIS